MNSQKYQDKFGLIPEFKAGVHFGEVSRGRVGFIKKELLFTGDVLNTTARIQSLCNKLESNLLISKMLRDKIHAPDFDYVEKGSYALRGRKKEESLIEVLTA